MSAISMVDSIAHEMRSYYYYSGRVVSENKPRGIKLNMKGTVVKNKITLKEKI